MSEQEEWRPIPGWPDYRVSSLGRVLSIKRGQSRFLTGGKTDQGYRNVLLYDGRGHRKTFRIHALVAVAFYGPRPDGLEIRHLNGDQLDNAAANLRYGTHEENLADQRRHRGRLLIIGADPVPSWATRPERVQHGRVRVYRRRHCQHGGETVNDYIYPSGHRVCRPCKSASEAASRQRRALRAASVPSGRAA